MLLYQYIVLNAVFHKRLCFKLNCSRTFLTEERNFVSRDSKLKGVHAKYKELLCCPFNWAHLKLQLSLQELPLVLPFEQVLDSSPGIVTNRCAVKGFGSPLSGGGFQALFHEARQTVIKCLL
jgi:hypothetical protein